MAVHKYYFHIPLPLWYRIIHTWVELIMIEMCLVKYTKYNTESLQYHNPYSYAPYVFYLDVHLNGESIYKRGVHF